MRSSGIQGESEKQLCAETICFCYGVFNHDIIEIVKK